MSRDPFKGNVIHVVHEEVTVFAGRLDVAGIRIKAGEALVVHRPTLSLCWEQAWHETHALPSWERGQAHRRRYQELAVERGLLRTVP